MMKIIILINNFKMFKNLKFLNCLVLEEVDNIDVNQMIEMY